MSKLDLSIVIPSLNESQNLKKLIPEIKYEIGNNFKFEIILVKCYLILFFN